MTFRVKFETDNAAFGDDHDAEVARILRVIADKVERGHSEGACFDGNGNRVGTYKEAK